MRPLRVMRVIACLDVDGPGLQVRTLMRALDPALFEQRLYARSRPTDGTRRQRRVDEEVRVHQVNALGQSGASGNVHALRALVRAIRDFRPDVVHTHTAKAGTLGRLAAAVHGVPIRLHTFHGCLPPAPFTPVRARMVAAAERVLAHSTDRLIVGGAWLRDELLAAGIGRRNQFEVIPPGIGLRAVPTREEARRTLGLTRSGPVVAFVGSVSAAKRPDRMLAVARQVRTVVPDAQFLVCGEGDRLTATVNGAATHRLRMSFLGWRPDVETVYAAADLVLRTSDHESMPTCLIEAAMAGRPVVATDVGGVDEVVRHGETGLLTGRDIESLSRAVVRLLADDTLRERMGEAARTDASQRFGVAAHVDAMTRLYRQLAVQRGRWPMTTTMTTVVPTWPNSTTQAATTPVRSMSDPPTPVPPMPATTTPVPPSGVPPTQVQPAQVPVPQVPVPQVPVPQVPVPQVPVPQVPVPQAPVPQAPIPQVPVPQAPVPKATASPGSQAAATQAGAAEGVAAQGASTGTPTQAAATQAAAIQDAAIKDAATKDAASKGTKVGAARPAKPRNTRNGKASGDAVTPRGRRRAPAARPGNEPPPETGAGPATTAASSPPPA